MDFFVTAPEAVYLVTGLLVVWFFPMLAYAISVIADFLIDFFRGE